MDKDQVAEVLVNIATLLELKGENPFKTRAYQNAARTIETLSEPLDKLVAEARLAELKGIGEALQQKTPRSSPKRAWATSKASARRSSRRSPNSSPPAACSITRT